MTQNPEYAEPVPHLLGRLTEAAWQPSDCQPSCQPILSAPVFAAQPSHGYMDHYAVAPFQETALAMSPSSMYPCECAKAPQLPQSAGYAVVNVAVPVEAVTKTKPQLLLDPFLQPPDAPKFQHSKETRQCNWRKALAPGLVQQDQQGRAGNPEQTLQQPITMDARRVAGLFEDGKTTIMLRNIPNRYTCEEMLHDVISAGFDQMFDFFYLPMDFSSKRNRGYAFINFTSSRAARAFALAFHGRQLNRYHSKKILEVVPAVTQGYKANFAKYFEKDAGRIKNDFFRPMLFACEAFELD